MQEQWIQWQPLGQTIKAQYDFDSLINNADTSLTVFLYNSLTSQRLQLHWDGGLEAYSITQTFLKKKMILDLEQQQGKEIIGQWSFFKILNSKYIQWISEQSYTMSDYWNFTHYVIITPGFVIDIAQTEDPIITWI